MDCCNVSPVRGGIRVRRQTIVQETDVPLVRSRARAWRGLQTGKGCTISIKCFCLIDEKSQHERFPSQQRLKKIIRTDHSSFFRSIDLAYLRRSRVASLTQRPLIWHQRSRAHSLSINFEDASTHQVWQYRPQRSLLPVGA